MIEASRIVFLLVGALWVLIGVLTPPLSDRRIGPPMIFVSERADTALYGVRPSEVLESNGDLVLLRTTLFRVIAGFLVVGGLLIAALAWYGLQKPQTWALAVLTVVGLVAAPYWWISLAPYREAEITLSLGDIPPFMWVPSILMPIASALGWIHFLQP